MNIDIFYEKIGKRIKYLREQRHLTQDLLAEKAGISQDFLGKIEVCINRPGLKTIYKLSKALDVEAYEIFKFDECNSDNNSN